MKNEIGEMISTYLQDTFINLIVVEVTWYMQRNYTWDMFTQIGVLKFGSNFMLVDLVIWVVEGYLRPL